MNKTMDIFKQLEMAQVIYEFTYDMAKDLDEEMYYAMVEMLVEERCKNDGVNPVERLEMLLTSCKGIREHYGAY